MFSLELRTEFKNLLIRIYTYSLVFYSIYNVLRFNFLNSKLIELVYFIFVNFKPHSAVSKLNLHFIKKIPI